MCRVFFMHPSVDGYSGCFHVLATVSTAALNTGVHVSKRIKCYKNIPIIEHAEYKWSPSPGNFNTVNIVISL